MLRKSQETRELSKFYICPAFYVYGRMHHIWCLSDVESDWGALIMSERLRSSCILIFVGDGRGLCRGCHFIKWSSLFNHQALSCTEVTLLGQTSLERKSLLNNPIQHNEVEEKILVFDLGKSSFNINGGGLLTNCMLLIYELPCPIRVKTGQHMTVAKNYFLLTFRVTAVNSFWGADRGWRALAPFPFDFLRWFI